MSIAVPKSLSLDFNTKNGATHHTGSEPVRADNESKRGTGEAWDTSSIRNNAGYGEAMYNEDLCETQKVWAERALMATRSLLSKMEPVSSFREWQSPEQQAILHLLAATARTSESAFLLCAYGQLWDAEVLVRSVLEGSLKLAYLLQARETFAVRYCEYAEQLWEIALLKGHRKAETLLANVSDPDAPEWQPIREILASDVEIAEISSRYDRTTRRNLETRWGFTGLIGELSRSGDPYFNGLGALAHNYSMASHVQHADTLGVSIPLERDLRSVERRDSIHLAHEGRLLSDLLAFLFMRLAVGYRFVGADMSQLVAIKATIDEAQGPFAEAGQRWRQIEFPDNGNADPADSV